MNTWKQRGNNLRYSKLKVSKSKKKYTGYDIQFLVQFQCTDPYGIQTSIEHQHTLEADYGNKFQSLSILMGFLHSK
jgi:hypothetical protein